MATWKSVHKVKWDYDTGINYADCENSWEYQTVSDYLTVKTLISEYATYTGRNPASEKMESYSKSEALALLETLIDWAERFEGQGTVEELISKVRRLK